MEEISAVEGASLIEAGAGLLDVREADEWRAGHAPAAVFIPMAEVLDRRVELPSGRIVVICRSGGRSGLVAEGLLAQGIDAVNLAGGMQAWLAAGLPVVTDGGEPGRVI